MDVLKCCNCNHGFCVEENLLASPVCPKCGGSTTRLESRGKTMGNATFHPQVQDMPTMLRNAQTENQQLRFQVGEKDVCISELRKHILLLEMQLRDAGATAPELPNGLRTLAPSEAVGETHDGTTGLGALADSTLRQSGDGDG